MHLWSKYKEKHTLLQRPARTGTTCNCSTGGSYGSPPRAMHLWWEYREKHMVLTGGSAQLAGVLQLRGLHQDRLPAAAYPVPCTCDEKTSKKTDFSQNHGRQGGADSGGGAPLTTGDFLAPPVGVRGPALMAVLRTNAVPSCVGNDRAWGLTRPARGVQRAVEWQNSRSNPSEDGPGTLETRGGCREIRFSQAETTDINQVARP